MFDVFRPFNVFRPFQSPPMGGRALAIPANAIRNRDGEPILDRGGNYILTRAA